MQPKALPKEELVKMKDDYDFEFVFGEKSLSGNTPPIGFTRVHVAEAYLIEYGDNDGPEWRCIGRLTSGDYFRATGGCDYTGWDCQASNSGETWPDLDAFIRGLGDNDRALLGLSLDGLGSSVVRLSP